MATLRNLASSLLIALIVAAAFGLYFGTCVDYIDLSPAAIHRARLWALAAAIEMYAMDEGHLPATLDDLASPNEAHCLAPNERPRDDYRRDPDGVRVDYTIIDARSLRYRIAIPAHTTKSGAWVPNTHIEESAPDTPP